MRVFFFLIILYPSYLFGQYQITGKVIDSKTKEPLAFVNIITVNQKLGATTDIDGKFVFNSSTPIAKLKLSYVGYEIIEMDVSNQQNITIKLQQTSYQIEEFKVFPGVNPAERIIKEVIKNRKKHNPEKSLNFKYESYNKMYFTALMDTTLGETKLDSNNQEMIDWLENQYLFMIESVTERKYKQPDKSYEKIIASKISGFSNPMFSLIATELQSFTFYNPTLKLLDNFYLNPITVNSINKYLFLIEDTTYNGADTVFILSFRPRKGKNFDALKGLLYINTDGYALQNVIAEPFVQDEMISIKIQQQYEKISGSWFPVQLNSDLIFEETSGDGVEIVGINRTYIKNIEINPEISNKEFSNVVTEIDDKAIEKDSLFWGKYRQDSLSQKEKNTYHALDSIGEKYHFDRNLKILEALGEGKINWGIIDFDLNYFLGENKYEGFRLGMGLRTSKKVLKWASVGAYGAYAFKDKEEKYGADINFIINNKNDIVLKFFYQKDVAEPGVVSFTDYRIPTFSTAGNRRFFNLERMNNVEKIGGQFQFRTARYLTVYLFAHQETVAVTNGYFYKKRIDENTILKDQYYVFNEVGIEFRYAFKEKMIRTPSRKYPTLTRYPILYAKIERGVKDFDGEYTYTRFSFRAEKRFFIKNLGHPKFYIETGYVNGEVPQHKLNSSLGTLTKPGNSFSSIDISTENAFETMLPYEFFSNKYLYFHFRHSFGALLFKVKKFEPELVITSSAGFGSLSNKNAHDGVDFKTLEKGYFESGIVINHIIRFSYLSFGVGGFYRYGPYRFQKSSDNIAVKLSLGFVIPKKTVKKRKK